MVSDLSLDLDDVGRPKILEIRGESVILDRDVARLFGVETKVLNQQVKRNRDRFGTDFAFKVSEQEYVDLRSQIVTSNEGRGGARYRPTVFTEHGVVMAATLLHSKRASQASRFIVKSFVQARRNLSKMQRAENLPATIVPKSSMPLAAEMRQNIAGKINEALGQVLNAIVDPSTNKTVGDEAREIANEGLKADRHATVLRRERNGSHRAA